jgi:hypothetical protein
MEARAKAQRRRADRRPADSSVIRVEMKDGTGSPHWVAANLIDVFGGGCGLALLTLLKSGSTVVVRGKLGENRPADQLKAVVRWCVKNSDGTFRSGLEFLDRPVTPKLDEEQGNSIPPAALDCYEVMQLSPNADAETISRVYRMLAFRYHPDNAATGNSEMFLRLSQAHDILSDPAKRASYDSMRSPGRNLDQRVPSTLTERVKRRNLEAITDAYLGAISLGSTVCWEG